MGVSSTCTYKSTQNRSWEHQKRAGFASWKLGIDNRRTLAPSPRYLLSFVSEQRRLQLLETCLYGLDGSTGCHTGKPQVVPGRTHQHLTHMNEAVLVARRCPEHAPGLRACYGKPLRRDLVVEACQVR